MGQEEHSIADGIRVDAHRRRPERFNQPRCSRPPMDAKLPPASTEPGGTRASQGSSRNSGRPGVSSSNGPLPR